MIHISDSILTHPFPQEQNLPVMLGCGTVLHNNKGLDAQGPLLDGFRPIDLSLTMLKNHKERSAMGGG